MIKKLSYLICIIILIGAKKPPKKSKLQLQVEAIAAQITPKAIEWRHHLHQYPELSNREYKTAKYLADHLRALGLDVETNVAKTGVVAILKGGKPGPVIALRADIDGLPVPERVDIPWASKQKGLFNGNEVPVMHACGHDTHTAILMGVAEVLTKVKPNLKGTVKFIFQPAEEGAPKGEEGGAKLMIKEGVLKNPNVEAIFGLHIASGTHVGQINYKKGATMASSNSFEITIHGKQTHGSRPWNGVDPIVTAAQIINNAQTIISRNMPLTKEAAVLTFGSIHGGLRSNIIPEEVKLVGTIRALDNEMRDKIIQRLKTVARKTAESNEATVDINIHEGYPITFNDIALTDKMLPTLKDIVGSSNLKSVPARTGAEDFSFFQQKVPGFYFFLGGTPTQVELKDAPPHHTPDFYVDDSAIIIGIKAMSRLVVDYSM